MCRESLIGGKPFAFPRSLRRRNLAMDGPLEGGRPALHSAVRRFLGGPLPALRALSGAMEGETPSLQARPCGRKSEGLLAPGKDVSSEGRHSAFPARRQARFLHIRKKRSVR